MNFSICNVIEVLILVLTNVTPPFLSIQEFSECCCWCRKVIFKIKKHFLGDGSITKGTEQIL